MDFEDILAVELKGDNVRGYLNDWELTLNAVKEIPSEDILENLVRRQLEKSNQLSLMMQLYNQDVTQRGEPRSYTKLIQMANIHLNQQCLEQNRNEMMGRGRDRRSVTPVQGGRKDKRIKRIKVHHHHPVKGIVPPVEQIREVFAR